MVTVDTLQSIISDFHQAGYPDFRHRALEVPVGGKTIITVIGPRRAGKTYYLYQMMNDLERCGVERERMLYLNFEDERLMFEQDYDVIFDAYRRFHERIFYQ